MTEKSLHTILTERLQAVEERILAACQRAGRNRADVAVVAVTKTISPATAAVLPEMGVLDLGENRPQELWHKAEVLPKNVRWHMIGHLQRNKIERTLEATDWIHSVDSARLLRALDDAALGRAKPVNVLLEVNASREASKHGFAPREAGELAPVIGALRNVHVRGLMTMAAPEEDPERCRPTFGELRRLRETLSEILQPPHNLRHLSMGMSNDFEIAIEEGATLLRLGTVLFEGLT